MLVTAMFAPAEMFVPKATGQPLHVSIKLVPVIVTFVGPPIGPEFGVTEVTVGADVDNGDTLILATPESTDVGCESE